MADDIPYEDFLDLDKPVTDDFDWLLENCELNRTFSPFDKEIPEQLPPPLTAESISGHGVIPPGVVPTGSRLASKTIEGAYAPGDLQFERFFDSLSRGELNTPNRLGERPQPGDLGTEDVWVGNGPHQREPSSGYQFLPNDYPVWEPIDHMFHCPGVASVGLPAPTMNPGQIPSLRSPSIRASNIFVNLEPQEPRQRACLICQIDKKKCEGTPVCTRCRERSIRYQRNPNRQEPMEDFLFVDISEWQECISTLKALLTPHDTIANSIEELQQQMSWLRTFQSSSPVVLHITNGILSKRIGDFHLVALTSPTTTGTACKQSKDGCPFSLPWKVCTAQFDNFVDVHICSAYEELSVSNPTSAEAAIWRSASRCSGYISLLFSLDESDIITNQGEELMGRDIVFELVSFFVRRINELYGTISRDIIVAFRASDSQQYPRTAICALEIVLRSLKSYPQLSWECSQLGPLDNMLQKMQTRSSVFLSQLESFEAQITATRCRGNMSLPPKPLEIARTGQRLPAVIKVTPIKHRLLLATDVDLDPFNSDGWKHRRTFTQMLQQRTFLDKEAEAEAREKYILGSDMGTVDLSQGFTSLDSGIQDHFSQTRAVTIGSGFSTTPSLGPDTREGHNGAPSADELHTTIVTDFHNSASVSSFNATVDNLTSGETTSTDPAPPTLDVSGTSNQSNGGFPIPPIPARFGGRKSDNRRRPTGVESKRRAQKRFCESEGPIAADNEEKPTAKKSKSS
ncbi:MAG: hypothetical protein M1813_008946 [Trichoglossum hirsutum]|nr:MAG: hypothetical protein M1813_008946 [Trichoglossum hirsutum]